MTKAYMTRVEVAEYLRISFHSMIWMWRSGKIPYMRWGKRGVMVPKSALDKLTDSWCGYKWEKSSELMGDRKWLQIRGARLQIEREDEYIRYLNGSR